MIWVTGLKALLLIQVIGSKMHGMIQVIGSKTRGMIQVNGFGEDCLGMRKRATILLHVTV